MALARANEFASAAAPAVLSSRAACRLFAFAVLRAVLPSSMTTKKPTPHAPNCTRTGTKTRFNFDCNIDQSLTVNVRSRRRIGKLVNVFCRITFCNFWMRILIYRHDDQLEEPSKTAKHAHFEYRGTEASSKFVRIFTFSKAYLRTKRKALN
jgi:hypothetical protein